MIRFFFRVTVISFFSRPTDQTNLIMDNSATTTTSNFNWNQTCAHDATWFQENSKTNPRSHHRLVGAPEWWFKNQISIIWDPITQTYIYRNKNTALTFEDPDQALFEEELPVLEIEDEPIDSRLSKYPNITALYNPGTDHYWYHNSFTGTTHFTLNQALFITQHLKNAWVTSQIPHTTHTPSPGLGMMFDPEYEVDSEDTFDWNRNFNKAKNEIATSKYGVDGWHQVKDNEVLAYMNQQTTPLNTLSCHEEVGESEGEEEEVLPPFQLDLSHLISEVNEEQNRDTTTNNAWCGTHIRFPDTDYDPVFDDQYYGREAQKRDWANMDYQDFINSS